MTIKQQNKIKLDDRIHKTGEKNAFVTLKDHKPNFINNPTCRLLNPTKSNIGRISKQILEDVNSKVRKLSGLNQWKNTFATVEWFKNLPSKKSLHFIQFDIVNFYPSITENLLQKSLNYARNFVDINEAEENIKLSCKESILFHDNYLGKNYK